MASIQPPGARQPQVILGGTSVRTPMGQSMMGGQPFIVGQSLVGGQPVMGVQPFAGGQPLMARTPGGAMVQMPVSAAGMPPPPEPIPGCPPGLEYLRFVDQLLVHQQLQLLELFVPYEQQNKYVVKNTMGQFIFMAVEESDLASRCCCGNARPFEMALLDYRSVEVMRLFRPLRCDSCLCFCCLQEMEVHAPPGTIIGSIRQECTVIFPLFSVLDSNKNVVLQIRGPFITSSCLCNDVVFDIFTGDGRTKVGFISKNWSGVLREAFTDIDNFTVAFPIDMDVKIKAVLLGALLLIVSICLSLSIVAPLRGKAINISSG